MSFSGKSFVIEGATGALGSATIQLLHSKGARLLLVGRSAQKLQFALSQLGGAGGHSIAIINQANVLDDFKNILREKEEDFGQFSGLAILSGLVKSQPVRQSSKDVTDSIFDANYSRSTAALQAFRLSKSFANESSVVLMSSVSAVVGEPGFADYGASKAALEAYVRASAAELSRDSMRVNAIRAGLFESPSSQKLKDTYGQSFFEQIEKRHLLGVGKPVQVAQAVSFLLSDDANWITGSVLTVDGGYSSH